MSGLMMVFLFISIALMRHALIERDKIKEVAVAYQNNQVALYEALKTEFEPDLQRWNAEINKDTLSFEFKSPDIFLVWAHQSCGLSSEMYSATSSPGT